MFFPRISPKPQIKRTHYVFTNNQKMNSFTIQQNHLKYCICMFPAGALFYLFVMFVFSMSKQQHKWIVSKHRKSFEDQKMFYECEWIRMKKCLFWICKSVSNGIVFGYSPKYKVSIKNTPFLANMSKYFQLEQIRFAIWTYTFCNLDKYI